jgi:hypothetical protein
MFQPRPPLLDMIIHLPDSFLKFACLRYFCLLFKAASPSCYLARAREVELLVCIWGIIINFFAHKRFALVDEA